MDTDLIITHIQNTFIDISSERYVDEGAARYEMDPQSIFSGSQIKYHNWGELITHKNELSTI